MTPDKKWFSGGYPINDHEIEVPDPKQIKPQNHIDMSTFGTDWSTDYTGFNESASEDDKKGIDFQKYCLDCYTILDYRVK